MTREEVADMGMPVSAVMTRDVVTVAPEDSWLAAVRRLEEHHLHALPVVETDGKVVGIVAETDFLAKEERLDPRRGRVILPHPRNARRARAQIVKDVMTRRPVVARPSTTLGAAARLMHRRRVGRLPVVDEDQRLLGIVSRSDLLSVFLRNDIDLENALRADVAAMGDLARDIDVRVLDAVAELTGSSRYRSDVEAVRRTAGQVPGVVDVRNRMRWEVDDLYATSAGA